MGCRTLIGVTRPDAGYTARWLHWGGHPDHLIPQLRRIWRNTFGRDTATMALSLLRHDWSDLSSDQNLTPRPGRVAVPGLGYAQPASSGREPRRGTPQQDTVGTDLEWLYLIDPAAHTVAVHEATVHSTWLPHSAHHLEDPAGHTEPAAPSWWAQTLAAARRAGEAAARDAAAWWAQDTVGSRRTADVTPTARRILAGIDDGDPEILDALPAGDPPAAPEAEPELYQEITSADAPPWLDLDDGERQALNEAYRDGFEPELAARIASACKCGARRHRPAPAARSNARRGREHAVSRRRAPAYRCEFQVAVWGPHPGCREYMSEPAFLYRCRAPATHVLKRDTEPAFVAPTYPPPRRHHPDPCCPGTGRVRERVRVCGEHVNELHNPTGSGRSRVYRFRAMPWAAGR
ncbi:MAG: hypothetical protein ACRDT2_08820 [Natronosporangium sp.]